jgi:hypothetical protein
MYQKINGEKVSVNFSEPKKVVMKANPSPSATQKTSGENKEILYAALILGFIVFLLALFLLYRHFVMNKPQKFGYNKK